MRLRHADRQPVEPVRGVLLDLVLGRLQEDDAAGAVDLSRDRLDLGVDRRVERIGVLERVRVVGGVGDGLGERRRAFAAPLECLVQLGRVRAVLEREPTDELDLLVRVAGEAVDRDDGPEAELRG